MKIKPNYYAFFDVDGTLINTTTPLSFLKYYYLKRYSYLGVLAYKKYSLRTKLLSILGKNREFFNKDIYTYYKNQNVEKIKTIGKKWFKEEIHNKNMYLNNVVKEMINHQINGGEIVLVSGSFDVCLEPFAEQFNIKHIIASTLEIKDGQYTGSILPPQTIGNGKAEAIRQFLIANDYHDYKNCFAYGDHHSDIQMLSLVGNPKVVEGDHTLEMYANNHGWEIIKNEI